MSETQQPRTIPASEVVRATGNPWDEILDGWFVAFWQPRGRKRGTASFGQTIQEARERLAYKPSKASPPPHSGDGEVFLIIKDGEPDATERKA